ncbi:MAG: LysR family transcriptional regulator [Anaerovibrio sp.]|nr:LysR family transcriptional regulator [Anaerovibrio sp.]
MELRTLRYFLTVVREENISRAAELLHITQPTLSRQMQELEKELDTKLFLRGKTKITLTDSGVLLRRRAAELVELADKTAREFLDKEENLGGVVSIGCGESSAVKALTKIIGDFSAAYPEVKFEIYTGTGDNIKELIEHGILDIGLLIEPIEVTKYEYLRLKQREQWGVLMRRDNPLSEKASLTSEEVSTMPLILPRRTGAQSALREWFGTAYPALNVVATCNLVANSARLTLQGVASAVTIEGAVDMYHNPELCFRPLEPALTNASVLVWKRYQPFSQATVKFMEYLSYAVKT